jgi:broad specificity phosphatase PhoE
MHDATSLTLVRHGQASFLAEEYDRLSDLGIRQARLLGRWWAAHGVRFDRVVYGPAARHRASGDAAAAEFRDACGLAWPEPFVQPELDEFEWLNVFQVFVPLLAARDPEIREMAAAYQQVQGAPEEAAHFDALFKRVMPHWLDGTLEHDNVEPWDAFRARVRRGLDALLAANHAARITVFSSAGVIGAVAADALDLTPANTIKLIMATRNGAWSEFTAVPGRIALDVFNCAPHLAGSPELLTYR